MLMQWKPVCPTTGFKFFPASLWEVAPLLLMLIMATRERLWFQPLAALIQAWWSCLSSLAILMRVTLLSQVTDSLPLRPFSVCLCAISLDSFSSHNVNRNVFMWLLHFSHVIFFMFWIPEGFRAFQRFSSLFCVLLCTIVCLQNQKQVQANWTLVFGFRFFRDSLLCFVFLFVSCIAKPTNHPIAPCVLCTVVCL